MQMLTRVHTAGESSAGHEDRGAALKNEKDREREREINTGIAPRENHACNYPTRAWATPFHLHHPPRFTASFITFCPPRLPPLEAVSAHLFILFVSRSILLFLRPPPPPPTLRLLLLLLLLRLWCLLLGLKVFSFPSTLFF